MGRIRKIAPGDEQDALRMRLSLWPGPAADHLAELEGYFEPGEAALMLVAERPQGGGLCGFAEASMRSHAEGCDPSRPVAFLEGWYVDEDQRRRGVGAALIAAVEDWARSAGCVELASDAELENQRGHRAHIAVGFEEVERAVQFRKALGPARGNLRDGIPAELPDELVTLISRGRGFRVERIVSRGHSSPPGFWYDQDEDELVFVLAGAARLELEGTGEVALSEGDWLDIGRHIRHRVTWTAPDRETIWLAVFRRPG